MWLVPSSFVAEPAELLSVSLMVGHRDQAEAVPRDSRRIIRFQAVDLAAETANRPASYAGSTRSEHTLDLPGFDGRTPLGHLRPDRAGAQALIYESTAAFSELPPAAFEAYLREEGLDVVQAARVRRGEENMPGRELYSRSLKSLVRVGQGRVGPEAASIEASRVDRPLGLPLEFVLQGEYRQSSQPARAGGARTGDREVVLHLLWQGEPLAGALVDMVPLSAPAGDRTHQSVRTGADGSLRVALGAGAWMASSVHAERATGDEVARAEWRTFFASLTFAIEDR